METYCQECERPLVYNRCCNVDCSLYSITSYIYELKKELREAKATSEQYYKDAKYFERCYAKNEQVITEYRDKLSRRNMQIRDLKTKVQYLEQWQDYSCVLSCDKRQSMRTTDRTVKEKCLDSIRDVKVSR